MAYNLLPRQFKPQRPPYVSYTVAVLYLIICLCLGAFIIIVQNLNTDKTKVKNEKSNYITEISARRDKLSSELSNLDNQLNQDQEYLAIKSLQNKFTEVNQTYAFSYKDFIEKLNTITESGVGIQSISSTNGQINIEIEATTKEFADRFEVNLRTLNLFSNVTGMQIGEAGSNKYRYTCVKK